jgi:CheY-like chemotaxis protein
MRRSGTEVCRLIVFVQEARQMPVQILVVDDDALSREVLALLLYGAGYAVETADSGDAALLHLQTAQLLPQVVLTDLQMPGTTGNELALQLRGLCGPATMLLSMSATGRRGRSRVRWIPAEAFHDGDLHRSDRRQNSWGSEGTERRGHHHSG